MTPQASILKILEDNYNQPVSGNVIAKSLGLSEYTIQQSINQLRQKGYPIISMTDTVYVLTNTPNRLSHAALKPWLHNPEQIDAIHLYQTIDSTNTRARQLAEAGAPDQTVIIAEAQTNGRGRMGRSFFSPENTGLYMSMILRPSANLEHSLFITIAACVLVRQAIEKVTGCSADIKWVNDLYYQGKKICGILTEAVPHPKNSCIDYIILGVGINLLPPKDGFPEELKQKAGALLSDGNASLRIQLAAESINQLNQLSTLTDTRFIMEDYRKHSLVIGKRVRLTIGSRQLEGIVQTITDQGFLELITDNGSHQRITSGEVSLILT